MNYTKQYISSLSHESGFNGANIEKVIRLLDVINYLFSERYKSYFILKGGTAINLAFSQLKRLSVDIDLDYIKSLDKDVVIVDKKIIENDLDEFMIRNGYNISDKSRSSHILFSRMYSYINAYGNKDNIKIEINFIDRVHVTKTQSMKLSYFNKDICFDTLAIEELYGMKFAALINRSKPRDLYDCYYFINAFNDIDKTLLKKNVIFYLSLDEVYLINDNLYNQIRNISSRSIKQELLPVISKETFNNEIAIKLCINYLKDLLNLSEEEKDYLNKLNNKIFEPSLLFDKEISDILINHPMMKWIIRND